MGFQIKKELLNLVLQIFKGKEFRYRLPKIAHQNLLDSPDQKKMIMNLIHRPLLVYTNYLLTYLKKIRIVKKIKLLE